MVKDWQEELAGLTQEQITRGYENWQENWPPCVQEFKNICLKEDDKHGGRDFTPPYLREQPTFEAPRLESDQAKEQAKQLRQHRKSKLEKLKKEIYG